MITNGTNDPIKLSAELEKPRVILLHQFGGGLGSGSSMDEIASVRVDANARFSFDLDLYEDDDYYLGFYDMDDSKYVNLNSWYHLEFYPITPGISNTGVKVYVLAHSWIRPRFINTNNDPNNIDVFDLVGGIGSPDPGVIVSNFIGLTDTIMPWLYKTWSGQTQYGGANHGNHEVRAKLTRNGVTTDIVIPYFVPPFDTTVVEIKY